jgi:hypothetical protein
MLSTKKMCNICSFVVPHIQVELEKCFKQTNSNMTLNTQYDFLSDSNPHIQDSESLYSHHVPQDYLIEKQLKKTNQAPFKSKFFEYFCSSTAFTNVLSASDTNPTLKINKYDQNKLTTDHKGHKDKLESMASKLENVIKIKAFQKLINEADRDKVDDLPEKQKPPIKKEKEMPNNELVNKLSNKNPKL